MSKTFKQGREEIAKLCKYFADNRQDFFAPGVKEAHVRQSLIDPFFEALDWDMRNAAMTALQYREVIPEDSLEIEGQQKAPDYTFRVGTLAKFYTEAKKCGININADPGPAYQLRRYGWSARVPLSILTDFEELSVYDCSQRPRPVDKASYGRIQYFRDEEYPDRWRELWDIFSREAVWAGAYDRYAASKRKRGTSEVDSEFLKEIEGWRDSLARNIAMRNLYLGYDDLNTAVQRTIDRVIFLRMAEDRGSESYGQLLKLCERPGIYARFVGDLCRKADEKYNSGLFHFKKEDGIAESPDQLTPKLQIDDKVFKPILQNLYFENGSPYHFGVLPVEILGTVYERFLGKVIRLTADHRAKVEEKPEVRKAGGVYYTPAYIVNYIVTNTVGKMIEGKSPAQLAGGKSGQPLRVLDMACGSGSFLLGAYQCLLDHSLKWYLENRPEKHKEAVYFDGRRKFWRLNINEKKRILTTHIFGVDIDLQAVEVSKLSLLLKVLEGETDETVGQSRQLFHERALPNLSNNIKCGNSLIGPDYFSGRLLPDPDEMKRVNPFDWNREFPDAMKSGGFDCVIGNPPYGYMISDKEQEYFLHNYKYQDYEKDLYLLFLERYSSILVKNGLLGVIISNTWLQSITYKSIRKYLANEFNWITILHLPEKVFKAIVDTHVLIFQRVPGFTPKNEKIKIEIKDNCGIRLWHKLSLKDLPRNGDSINIVASEDVQDLYRKIRNKSRSLSEFCDVYNGIKPFEKGKGIPPQTDEIMKDKPYVTEGIKPSKKWSPLLRGSLINRYRNLWNNDYWILYGEWLAAPRDATIFKALNKIVVRQTGDSIIAVIVDDSFFERDNLHIIISKSNKYDLRLILAIINSSLVEFYYSIMNPEKGEALAQVKKYHVEQLPIPPIDLSNPSDKLLHDNINKIVSLMLDLHNKLLLACTEHEKTIIQRQIDATDREIDRLVYELYGLTEKEIKIVENTGP